MFTRTYALLIVSILAAILLSLGKAGGTSMTSGLTVPDSVTAGDELCGSAISAAGSIRVEAKILGTVDSPQEVDLDGSPATGSPFEPSIQFCFDVPAWAAGRTIKVDMTDALGGHWTRYVQVVAAQTHQRLSGTKAKVAQPATVEN